MNKSILHFFNTHKTLLAQIVLVILFIGILAWGAFMTSPSLTFMQAEKDDHIPDEEEIATPVPTPNLTTTPVEFTPNQSETDGIIFAGIVLVLIIVIGTLGVIRGKG
jgi:amino acid transporter